MDPSGIEASDEERSGRASSSSRGGGGFGPPTLAERVDDALVRLDRLRDRPIAAAITVTAVVVLAILAWWSARPDVGAAVDERIPQVSLATPRPAEDQASAVDLVIHVSGAVVRPGVVRLPASARVLDAVEAAGGPTVDADLHRLNLAAPLVDGVQIRVPAIGDVVTGSPETFGLDPTVERAIDVNTATAAELERLDGVGPSIADAIVSHREEHGPFRRVEDLLAVTGIGPAKLEAIIDDAVAR